MDRDTDRAQLPREGLIRAEPGGIELREPDDGPPVLKGHFAVFNEWTEINSLFEGRFLEQIAPGAFRKTIAEGRERMKVLLNHGRDTPLGNTPMGKITDLAEDQRGAAYEVDLFDGLPPHVLDGLRAGEYGSSFRFTVLRERFDHDPGTSKHNPEGIPERVIQEARVQEFGPVTFPAYAGADAGIRSLTDDYLLPESLLRRLAGAAAPAQEDPSAARESEDDTDEGEEEEETAARRDTPPVHDYLRTGKERPEWIL